MIVIPVRTVSEANTHTHWRERARRAKTQRLVARSVILGVMSRGTLDALPLVVTITRVAPRALDDDNLASSQKAIRDGIADALGIDDRDPRVSWRYAQRRGDPKKYFVEVSIEARTLSSGVRDVSTLQVGYRSTATMLSGTPVEVHLMSDTKTANKVIVAVQLLGIAEVARRLGVDQFTIAGIVHGLIRDAKPTVLGQIRVNLQSLVDSKKGH